MNKKYYMAIDQHGNTEHGLEHPRKDLMKRYDTKHAEKMYIDTTSGQTFHTGYIVRGHWFRLFEVIPYRRALR